MSQLREVIESIRTLQQNLDNLSTNKIRSELGEIEKKLILLETNETNCIDCDKVLAVASADTVACTTYEKITTPIIAADNNDKAINEIKEKDSEVAVNSIKKVPETPVTVRQNSYYPTSAYLSATATPGGVLKTNTEAIARARAIRERAKMVLNTPSVRSSIAQHYDLTNNTNNAQQAQSAGISKAYINSYAPERAAAMASPSVYFGTGGVNGRTSTRNNVMATPGQSRLSATTQRRLATPSVDKSRINAVLERSRQTIQSRQ